jgi:hypothetical protein
MFTPYTRPLALIAVLTVSGCVSQSQFLASKEPLAIQTALQRARFEIQCPEATGTVLSREVLPPVLEGPRVGGIQRAQYTVGVAGCGQHTTSVVLCPEGGDGCFAVEPERLRGQ